MNRNVGRENDTNGSLNSCMYTHMLYLSYARTHTRHTQAADLALAHSRQVEALETKTEKLQTDLQTANQASVY
jgi:hypothetical protein